MVVVKALVAASGGSADDVVVDGLNRRDLDVALRQWVDLHTSAAAHDSRTGTGSNVDQLEKVGRLMMSIGSRLEPGDSATENDQTAIKRRVEAVWKLRQVGVCSIFPRSG